MGISLKGFGDSTAQISGIAALPPAASDIRLPSGNSITNGYQSPIEGYPFQLWIPFDEGSGAASDVVGGNEILGADLSWYTVGGNDAVTHNNTSVTDNNMTTYSTYNDITTAYWITMPSGYDTGTQGGWRFGLFASANVANGMNIYRNGSASDGFVCTSDDITRYKFAMTATGVHHVAWSLTPDDNTIKFYVDGILKGTFVTNGITHGTDSVHFRIESAYINSGFRMINATVFDGAMDQTAITALYNIGVDNFSDRNVYAV